VPTSSRIFFYISRLMVAVLALTSVGLLLPGGHGSRTGAPAGCARHGVPSTPLKLALSERGRRGRDCPCKLGAATRFFFIPPPSSQSALVAPRARVPPRRGGVCAEAAPPSGQERSARSAPFGPHVTLTHCPTACHPATSGQQTAAQARTHHTVRRTWCSTRQPRRRTRPAPRLDAPRPREAAPVGAATSGGAPPRAAAGTCSTPCVSPSAATNAAQASRSEPPSTRLSLAQGQMGDAPAPPHARRAHRARARARPASKMQGSHFRATFGSQLTRTPTAAVLCRARARDSARARTTTPPPHRRPARRAHWARVRAPPRLEDATYALSSYLSGAADAYTPHWW